MSPFSLKLTYIQILHPVFCFNVKNQESNLNLKGILISNLNGGGQDFTQIIKSVGQQDNVGLRELRRGTLAAVREKLKLKEVWAEFQPKESGIIFGIIILKSSIGVDFVSNKWLAK